jgi:mono/diheme cytochrome c family protein
VRVLVRVVVALVALAVVALGMVYALSERRIRRTYVVSVPPIAVPTDPDAIARGKRLATVVAPCGDCHGRDFGGKLMVDEWAMGTLYGTNLTQGRGGIAAAYTDADWVRGLLHGVRRDSRSVVFMPSHDFHFTEQDTADLIAFFRALPPIDRYIPGPRVGIMARALSFGPLPLLPAELIDHERVAFARPPQSTDRVVVGRHLSTRAAAVAATSPISREAVARLLAAPTSRRQASATGPMTTS